MLCEGGLRIGRRCPQSRFFMHPGSLSLRHEYRTNGNTSSKDSSWNVLQIASVGRALTSAPHSSTSIRTVMLNLLTEFAQKVSRKQRAVARRAVQLRPCARCTHGGCGVATAPVSMQQLISEMLAVPRAAASANALLQLHPDWQYQRR